MIKTKKTSSKPVIAPVSVPPMTQLVNVFVIGTPVAKGSAKAFKHARTGKVIVMQDNRERQKCWVDAIQRHVQWDMAQHPFNGTVTNPVSLNLTFYFARPKCHYNKAGMLKPNAPANHTQKPDLDKLLRCVKDALTGIVYVDDSQVVSVSCQKEWAAPNANAGVSIVAKAW